MIIEDRFRALLPCDDACNLRWREDGRGAVTFRHGKREKRIDTRAAKYTHREFEYDEFGRPTTAKEPEKGWMDEAVDWIVTLHGGVEDW